MFNIKRLTVKVLSTNRTRLLRIKLVGLNCKNHITFRIGNVVIPKKKSKVIICKEGKQFYFPLFKQDERK